MSLQDAFLIPNDLGYNRAQFCGNRQKNPNFSEHLRKDVNFGLLLPMADTWSATFRRVAVT